MTNAELERRVTQNKADVDAIYEMLTVISATQTHHGRSLNDVEARVVALDDRLTGRLDELDTRLTARLDVVDGRLDGIDGRLDGIDGRLDGINGRLDGINGRLDGINGRLDGIDGRLDVLQEGTTELLRRLPG